LPLSEDEQRILHEIERSFYENDPAFAREVGSRGFSLHAGRNLKLSAAGFVVGLLVLVTSFASNFVLGAAGFLLMLGSAFAFTTNVRRLGLGPASRARDLSGAIGDRGRRLRSRLQRDQRDPRDRPER
jgi:hypothetical protein